MAKNCSINLVSLPIKISRSNLFFETGLLPPEIMRTSASVMTPCDPRREGRVWSGSRNSRHGRMRLTALRTMSPSKSCHCRGMADTMEKDISTNYHIIFTIIYSELKLYIKVIGGFENVVSTQWFDPSHFFGDQHT